MEKKSVLMGAVPGVALAVLMVFAIPGAAIVSNVTNDSFPVHGYVTVSVIRDGNEIYHHEDHNLITDAGKDFIREQIGQTTASGAIDGNGANFIALTNTGITPAAGDTALSGEITANGLGRGAGSYAEVSTNQFTITRTFTASGAQSAQAAGLFTAAVTGTPGAGGDDGIMVAENTFTAVSLAANDQLTITWTVTLS
jgi:hypothetical protein